MPGTAIDPLRVLGVIEQVVYAVLPCVLKRIWCGVRKAAPTLNMNFLNKIINS